ncbi:predicted protein [Naegleria gruberi]|uniref:Predicted protein n=1 Tax=Naegleria gruberi TaxID=5762 RepID=D2UYP6_NAEGR|nr:uncharacterized protein NAEGRDRAFT_61543 [Naegleria gruberi]EFC50514.1 predicted protein [Naegleria gruberi]|eukprot:XP_002683258.1 predicted protein [Naegleria gruberi strain NEG-M]
MRQHSLVHLLFGSRNDDTLNAADDDQMSTFAATNEHDKNQENILVTMMVLAIASFSIFASEESFFFQSSMIYRLILFFLMSAISIGLLQLIIKFVNTNDYCRYVIYSLLIIVIAQFPFEKYSSLNLHDEKLWKHDVEYSTKVLLPTIYTNVTFSKIQHEYKLEEIAKWYKIPTNDTYLVNEDDLFYNSIPNDMNYCNYKASIDSQWFEYLKAAKDMTIIPLNRMKILEKFNSTMSFKLYKSVSKILNSIKSVHDLTLTKTRLEQGISNECKGDYFKLIWWDFNKESIMNCSFIIKFNTTERTKHETILDFERRQVLEPTEHTYIENLYKPEYKWAVARRTIQETEIFVSIQSKSVHEDFSELFIPYSNATTYSSSSKCREEKHTVYLGDFIIKNETKYEWVHSYDPILFYTGAIMAAFAFLSMWICKMLLIILIGFIIYYLIFNHQQANEEEHLEEEIITNILESTNPETLQQPVSSLSNDMTFFNVNLNEVKMEEQIGEEILLGPVISFEEMRNSRKSRPNQSNDSISQDSNEEDEELGSTLELAVNPSPATLQEGIAEQTTLLRVTRRKNPSVKRSFERAMEPILDIMVDDDIIESSPNLKKIKEE